jgi:hypothetical protein
MSTRALVRFGSFDHLAVDEACVLWPQLSGEHGQHGFVREGEAVLEVAAPLGHGPLAEQPREVSAGEPRRPARSWMPRAAACAVSRSPASRASFKSSQRRYP